MAANWALSFSFSWWQAGGRDGSERFGSWVGLGAGPGLTPLSLSPTPTLFGRRTPTISDSSSPSTKV